RDDAPGFAGAIPDRRVPSRSRFDRHDRAPQKNARNDQSVPQLLFGSVVNVGEALEPRPFSYREALAWLYGLQRFGIKLGLENIRRLLGEWHLLEGRGPRDRTDVPASQNSTLQNACVIQVAG